MLQVNSGIITLILGSMKMDVYIYMLFLKLIEIN